MKIQTLNEQNHFCFILLPEFLTTHHSLWRSLPKTTMPVQINSMYDDRVQEPPDSSSDKERTRLHLKGFKGNHLLRANELSKEDTGHVPRDHVPSKRQTGQNNRLLFSQTLALKNNKLSKHWYICFIISKYIVVVQHSIRRRYSFLLLWKKEGHAQETELLQLISFG